MSFALRLSALPTLPVPTRRDSRRQAEGRGELEGGEFTSQDNMFSDPNNADTFVHGTALAVPRTFLGTVLDSNGRFAIMLPHSWTHVQVRTESGLWKKVFLDGAPVVVPSGTPSSEAAFNYIPWNTTLQSGLGNWQDLQICYGDVNWNNVLDPAGSDGATITNRNLAQVRVFVPNSGMTTYNYNHLVDLNRDNIIDFDDRDILDFVGPTSGSFAGAQP